MIRLINITLALLAICGVSIAFYESSLKRDLLEEHRVLAAETGYLDVSDSNKVHIVALPSENPLHFCWRIYLPDKCTLIWKTGQLVNGDFSSKGPQNFIAHVHLRKDEDGFVRIFEDFTTVSSFGRLGGRELQNFMRDRWADVEISQLGKGGPVVVEPGNVETLLKLQLPDNIADEAESVLPASQGRRVAPVLYQIRFGTDEAWQKIDPGTSIGGLTNE